MTNTAVVEAEVISTAQLIQEGIAKGIDLVALKEILKLREIDDAFKARKAFAKDFALAQANIEAVIKTRTNNQTHSKYAELGDVIESAKPAYTKEGFSMIFYEGDCPKENHVRIYVDILHCAGHMETKHYDVPMDGKGLRGNDNMTAIHGKASSVSYGRRYLMCMIWNIPTSDTDGNTQALPVLTVAQLKTLRELITAKKIDEKKLTVFLKVETLEELPEKRYMEAMQVINATIVKTEVPNASKSTANQAETAFQAFEVAKPEVSVNKQEKPLKNDVEAILESSGGKVVKEEVITISEVIQEGLKKLAKQKGFTAKTFKEFLIYNFEVDSMAMIPEGMLPFINKKLLAMADK